MNDDKFFLAILGGIAIIFVVLIGILFYSDQDFANRCERSGGVLVKYSICLTNDSSVLMVK